MIIIEAGGSSTQVCQILNGVLSSITTYTGISPSYMPKESIGIVLKQILKDQEPDTSLMYYGTGCRQASAKMIIRECIQSINDYTHIDIYSDLLAAARVTANRSNGQINILGTGAASCLYENKKIKQVYFNSGYLFGDYGSGFQLGQALLKAYFEDRLSPQIELAIQEFTGETKQTLVKKIYTHESTKQYIASFARCMYRLKNDPQVNELIQASFSKFIHQQIQLNTAYKNTAQYFVGSIAYFFQEELTQAMKTAELQIMDICRSPIEKLIEYHLT